MLANPLSLLVSSMKRRPYFENFYWRPEGKTKFFVVNKDTNELVGTYLAPPCFSFHHLNSFEIKEDEIVVDMVCYDDASIVEHLYLDKLRSPSLGQPHAEVRRHLIQLNNPNEEVKYEVLFPISFELPRINYEMKNGKDYRFAYGVGRSSPNAFFDRLIKIDIQSRETIIWEEKGCHPSEPVFVASPAKQKERIDNEELEERIEDDGVVLSVVLNVEDQSSFLLVLDGQTFTEVARVNVNHQLPVALHGSFYGSL